MTVRTKSDCSSYSFKHVRVDRSLITVLQTLEILDFRDIDSESDSVVFAQPTGFFAEQGCMDLPLIRGSVICPAYKYLHLYQSRIGRPMACLFWKQLLPSTPTMTSGKIGVFCK